MGQELPAMTFIAVSGFCLFPAKHSISRTPTDRFSRFRRVNKVEQVHVE
jgi:hypothetical protein